MIKTCLKSLFFVFLNLSCAINLFPQAKNLISRKTYPCSDIKTLQTNLLFENLTIDSSYSDDIIIEIYTNNNLIIPQINLITQNSYKKLLKLDSSKIHAKKGDYCNIIMFLPDKFELETAKIELNAGNITINNFSANDLDIEKVCGSINLSNIQCNNISVFNREGNILCQESKMQYFFINTCAGNIVFELNSEPLAHSFLKTTNGRIDFYALPSIPFSVDAQISNGNIYDKISNKFLSHSNYFNAYNQGDVIIELQTSNGNITIEEL